MKFSTEISLGKPRPLTAKAARRLLKLIEHEPGRFVAQRKWDGGRVFGGLIGGKSRLFSRRTSSRTGKKIEYTEKFPALVSEMAGLLSEKVGDTVLDGELIARPSAGAPENREAVASLALSGAAEAQRKIEERGRGPELLVFGNPIDNGKPLFREPYAGDLRRLRELFGNRNGKAVHMIETLPLSGTKAGHFETIESVREKARDGGWEGFVVKDTKAPTTIDLTDTTQPREPGQWKERLVREGVDVIALGFEEGTGKHVGRVGALRCGVVDPRGEIIDVGCVGTGFSDRQREELKGREYPFAIEVRLQPPYWTKDGKMQGPASFMGIADKEVTECTAPPEFPGTPPTKRRAPIKKERTMKPELLLRPGIPAAATDRNEAFGKALRRIADLLLSEDHKENTFRVHQYRNAARVAEELGVDMSEVERPEDLVGIGASLASKWREWIDAGKLQRLEDLEAKVRTGEIADIADLRRIRGIGPVKALELWRQHGVRTIDELAVKLHDGTVRDDKLAAAVKAVRESRGRLRQDETETVLARVTRKLTAKVPGVEVLWAGSWRRGTETQGDGDLVAVVRNENQRRTVLKAFKELGADPSGGERKAAIQVDGFRVELSTALDRQSDAYPTERGAALATATGSAEFNQEMRRHAKDRGLILNERGLFDKQNRRLDDGTEKGVFRALGLRFVPPPLRLRVLQPVERLSRRDAMARSLHNHTTASDGSMSIQDLGDLGTKAGMKVVAVSDHVGDPPMNAASPETLREQREEVNAWNTDRLERKRLGLKPGPKMLQFLEVGIRPGGEIKGLVDAEALKACDGFWVAVHSWPKNITREETTASIIRALKHPKAIGLAHPTARRLGERDPIDADWDAISVVAAKLGKAIEINGQPKRLDATSQMAKAHVERGGKVALSADAHRPSDFVSFMRKAWAFAINAGVGKGDLFKPGKPGSRRGTRGHGRVIKSALAKA